MTGPIELRVTGLPVPQGSKTAFVVGKGSAKPRAVVAEAGSSERRQAHKNWRAAVAEAAAQWVAAGGRLLDEPVRVDLRFYFPPIASDPFRVRHATKPDGDKLVRSVFDALVDGGLLSDDSRVWAHSCSKMHSSSVPPGVEITVTPDGAAEQESRVKRKNLAAVSGRPERSQRG